MWGTLAPSICTSRSAFHISLLGRLAYVGSVRDSPAPSFLLGSVSRGVSTGDEEKGRKLSLGIYLSGFPAMESPQVVPQPKPELLFNSQCTQPSLCWVPETALYPHCFRRGRGKEPCCSCLGNPHHPPCAPLHPAYTFAQRPKSPLRLPDLSVPFNSAGTVTKQEGSETTRHLSNLAMSPLLDR